MTKSTKRFRWWVLGVLIVLPVAAGLVGIKMMQFQAMGAAQFTMPPEKVNATEVLEKDWRPRIEAVGSVVAVQGADVATEADGIVRRITFNAGSFVQAGQELVHLDTEIEEAQLREAEALSASALSYYDRVKSAADSVAATELDTAEARLKQADARVDNIKAIISKKTVRAPFTGKLGIRRISVGQFLPKGSPVVSLQSLDPVYVEFSLPQQRLGDVAEPMPVGVGSDSYPDQRFEGTITAVNPDVDPVTRNVRIQATLRNPGAKLRPGMFVSVELAVSRSERVLFIPETAVLHAPYGDSIFVVEEGPAGPDGKKPLVVQHRLVRLGAREGDYVVVTDGVKTGERIVSTGAFKLRPGMSVVIDNSLAPEFSFTPKPRNT